MAGHSPWCSIAAYLLAVLGLSWKKQGRTFSCRSHWGGCRLGAPPSLGGGTCLALWLKCLLSLVSRSLTSEHSQGFAGSWEMGPMRQLGVHHR